jgi:hypothetical protein
LGASLPWQAFLIILFVTMQSKATTVAQYLAELPEDRRAAMQAVRDVIRKNLDQGFEEGMQYGMIGYYVPHSLFPAGYHCDPRQPLPFAGLASQKNYMAIYLMTVYAEQGEEDWFRKAWAKTGKKLDMGKCCIRFKKLEDLALDVIGEAIRRVPLRVHVDHYEAAMRQNTARKGARPSTPPKKNPARSTTPSRVKKKAAKTKSTRKSR